MELRGDCTGGIKLFVFLGTEASSLFYVFEKGDEFILELGDGILVKNFVGVCILQ